MMKQHRNTNWRLVIALCLGTGLVSQVTAQEQPTAAPAVNVLGTSCFVAPARLADSDVQSFLADPSSILREFASGGLPLQNRVRSLVGSSSTAFEAIIELVSTANTNQAAAIGAGLARTVNACSTVDPDYADRILEAVAEFDNQDLLVAFSTALQETAVGAINGAPGGAAGGPPVIGGPQLSDGARNALGSNGRTFGGDDTVLNQAPGFSVGSGGNFIAASASPFFP